MFIFTRPNYQQAPGMHSPPMYLSRALECTTRTPIPAQPRVARTMIMVISLVSSSSPLARVPSLACEDIITASARASHLRTSKRLTHRCILRMCVTKLMPSLCKNLTRRMNLDSIGRPTGCPITPCDGVKYRRLNTIICKGSLMNKVRLGEPAAFTMDSIT